MKSAKLFMVFLLSLTLIIGITAVGIAADKPFYEGKNIRIIVPHGVGGGYDTYSRLVAKYLEKYLPGSTVIVDNKPGAGGTIGRNLAWASKPDGLTLCITSGSAMIYGQISEDKALQFDNNQWTWLARILGEPSVLAVAKNSEYNSIEDIKNSDRQVRFAVSGVGDDDFYALGIGAEALDINVLPVTGYAGTKEGSMAVIRGEVDAFQTSMGSMLPLINNDDVKPMLVYSEERDSKLPDVPAAFEPVENQRGRELMQAVIDIGSVNRVAFAPPGVDPERTEILRTAFEKVLTDADFLAEAKSINRPVAFLSGAEVEKRVKRCMTMADEIKPVLEKIIQAAQ